MATMKDVARELGLSVTTVSRALNGYQDVAEETRARIVEAARLVQAMQHLIVKGHRRIAYLDVDPTFSFSHFRLAGYREVLEHAGLSVDEGLICLGLTEADAPTAVRGLLALPEPPTAVFAA